MSRQLSRAQRRGELLALCQQQREEVAAQAQAARNTVNSVSASLNLIALIKRKPWLVGGIVLAVMIIKPRRIRGFFQKSFIFWQAWRTLAPTVQKLLNRS